jgi:hypothetical protein
MKLKTILTLVLSFLFFFYGSAQKVQTCLHVKVKTVEECEKAEACIEKLCDYVLQDIDKNKKDKIHDANKQIIIWMNVTMNFGFTASNEMMPLFEGENITLFSIYMVCMAKGAFMSKKHPDFEGLNLFLKYIKSPKNKVVETKNIKNFIRDWEKGKTKKYINRGTAPKK